MKNKDIINAVRCIYCQSPIGLLCRDRKHAPRYIPHQARRVAFAYYRERQEAERSENHDI